MTIGLRTKTALNMLPKLAMLAVATWVGALAKGVSPTFQFKVDESTVIGCGTFKFNFTRGVPPYTMTTIVCLCVLSPAYISHLGPP